MKARRHTMGLSGHSIPRNVEKGALSHPYVPATVSGTMTSTGCLATPASSSTPVKTSETGDTPGVAVFFASDSALTANTKYGWLPPPLLLTLYLSTLTYIGHLRPTPRLGVVLDHSKLWHR